MTRADDDPAPAGGEPREPGATGDPLPTDDPDTDDPDGFGRWLITPGEKSPPQGPQAPTMPSTAESAEDDLLRADRSDPGVSSDSLHEQPAQ